MKLGSLASLMLISLVVGCGGGGGGGDSNATQPPGGSNPPPGGANPPPGGGSTAVSTASITFPWRRSAALASTVTVRGTASDPDGIAGVRVNGVGATMTAPTVSAGLSSAPKLAFSDVQSASGSVLMSHGEAHEVEWSAEVELAPGDNDISVTVEDDEGDVTDSVDAVTIQYAEVPSPFTSDAGDPRILGWSTTLTETGELTRLVSFDHASGEQTVYPEVADIGVAACFRGATDDFVYLTFEGGDVWDVVSFNLETKQTQLVAELSPPLMSPGTGYSQGPFLMELACSGAHDYIYVLANFWENGDAVRTRVLRVDLAGNAEVLAETPLPMPGETPAWLAYTMGWATDSLVGVYQPSPAAPLVSIPLDGSDPSELAPAAPVGGLAVAPALDQDRVYVTSFDGIYEVNLASQSLQNISAAEPTEPLSFSNPDSIAIDWTGNRVIVGDADLTALVAVDLDTGDRSELLSRKVGAGPPMISPWRLALSSANDVAYVADNGINAPERLFAIDLATGDRRVVGPVHDGVVPRSLTGVALDEEGGQIYVGRFDGGTVLRVDLETENVEAITNSGDGMLEAVSDIVFDAPNQRLIVSDSATEAIVAVDVTTLQKGIVSRDSDVGAGPAFARLVSLSLGENGTVLYAADQAVNDIFRVDLQTGDRELLGINCPLSGPEVLQQVLYNATADELLILADGVFSFDLETAVCSPIPARFHPYVMRLTQDGRILAAGFNSLTQIDRSSGEVVIVSK